MKIKLLLIACVVAVFSVQSQEYLKMIDEGTYSVAEVVDAAEAYFEGKDKGRGTGYKQFKRWEYMALRLMNENGYLPSVTERMSELQNYNAYLNATADDRQVLADNWQELGPLDWNVTSGWNPGVGRITALAVDPANSDIIIIGANTGGVWKTTDGGQNWTPLNDNFVNLRVFSVAIDPVDSDVYYFGSSSGLIFKSDDAGATFTQLADISNSLVNKILINPNDTDIIFASSENAGLYRSTDAGVSWQSVTNDSRSYDVEFQPGNTNVVFASGSAYHKSTDGGATFTTMNAGFNNGPKMIGVSPDDASVVYVLQAINGGFSGLFKSTNNGDTFTQLNHAGMNYLNLDQNAQGGGGQAPRDMDIAISPTDIDEVHLGGGQTWRSLDGGVTFELSSFWFIPNVNSLNVGYCHADIDILEFADGNLFAGTDGGIFKAVDSDGPISTTYFEDLTEGIGIRQFYKIGVSQTADVIVSGGSQDNGTSVYTLAEGWRDWLGADGGETFVDFNNPNRIFGTTQFGNTWRTLNQGVTANSGNNPPGGGNFVTPFEQDPEVPSTIYIGYDRVYKSVNSGGSWTSISQSFGNGIEHFKIAPSNNQIIYAANGGGLYRTDDGGATTWQSISSVGGLINSIAVHPTDANKVAVTSTSTNKVFVSEDGGQTWTNLRLNLPNFSALAVVWDDHANNGLYLGMDFGVYYIDDSFTEWQPYSNLLPNVIINELEINHTTDMLYAGSYGRGLWVSPLVEPILGTTDRIRTSDVSVHPNPANETVTISFVEPLDAEIRVFDVSGKLVIYEADSALSTDHSLNISHLNAGVYFIRINSEAGSVTKKLIKK